MAPPLPALALPAFEPLVESVIRAEDASARPSAAELLGMSRRAAAGRAELLAK